MGYPFIEKADLAYIKHFVDYIASAVKVNRQTKDDLRDGGIDAIINYCDKICFLSTEIGSLNRTFGEWFDCPTKKLENKLINDVCNDKELSLAEKVCTLFSVASDGFPEHLLPDLVIPPLVYKVLYPKQKIDNLDLPSFGEGVNDEFIESGFYKEDMKLLSCFFDGNQKVIQEKIEWILAADEKIKTLLPEYATKMEAYEQEIIEKKKEEFKRLTSPKEILLMAADHIDTGLNTEPKNKQQVKVNPDHFYKKSSNILLLKNLARNPAGVKAEDYGEDQPKRLRKALREKKRSEYKTLAKKIHKDGGLIYLDEDCEVILE